MIKRFTALRTAMVIGMLLAAPCLAGEGGGEVGPWVKSLRPVPVQKSVFPSPQHWTAKPGVFVIPLVIIDTSPSGGKRFISTGVPLMVGQARATSELRLAVKNSAGELQALPAQFKVLARWWRFDNSIRWVLVDFQADVPAGGKPSFYLTNRKLAATAPPAKLIVNQTAAAITVTTGKARFVINRRAFNMIDGAWVDANSDGKFADSERVLKGTPTSGGVTQDALGNRYLAAAGTRSVEVIEAGPMRVRVRARGQHVNSAGKGYKPGMYGYDVFMDFYAGSADVFIDYVVTNNPPKSQGSPTIEDASVTLEFAENLTRYEVRAGKEAKSGTLAAKSSACLYQDSNGAKSWGACPGFGNMSTRGYSYPSGTVTSFRGWRLYSRTADAERAATEPVKCGKQLAEGQRARGLVVAASAGGGVAVNVRNFWRLFPKAIEIGPGRSLRISVLPRETKVVHYIEDTAACGTEFVLRFFAGDKSPAGLNSWADRWDHRLIARPPIKHLAACGALAETGPFTPPTIALDKKPDTRNCANSKRMFSSDRLYGNAYGWHVWGDRWRSNGGHGRRGARQPISQDNYLWRWWTTGVHDWFEAGEARTRHFRDVRIYRVENQDPFKFRDWKHFRANNRSEKWTKRPQPKSEEYKKYAAGLWKRTDWVFPNPEHTTLDLLYDRYLLFGDVRSLENMKIAAAHGGYFSGRGGNPIERGGWPWRANGWGWRTLLRYWELTGDAGAEKCLVDVIKRHSAYIGKSPLICGHVGKTNWWFTNIYCRAVAVTALQTGDPKALELCKTLAVGKEKEARRVPTLFAVLYHLTGEAKYKKLLLGEGNGGKMLSTGGYYTVCDHWLLNQPPRKK
jgi:PcRGLX-like protein central beta sandwich domain